MERQLLRSVQVSHDCDDLCVEFTFVFASERCLIVESFFFVMTGITSYCKIAAFFLHQVADYWQVGSQVSLSLS